MIVCLCHRISDQEIVRAVHSGTRSFDDLQDDTRIASACGCCCDSAREVFDHACASSCASGCASTAAPQPATTH